MYLITKYNNFTSQWKKKNENQFNNIRNQLLTKYTANDKLALSLDMDYYNENDFNEFLYGNIIYNETVNQKLKFLFESNTLKCFINDRILLSEKIIESLRNKCYKCGDVLVRSKSGCKCISFDTLKPKNSILLQKIL